MKTTKQLLVTVIILITSHFTPMLSQTHSCGNVSPSPVPMHNVLGPINVLIIRTNFAGGDVDGKFNKNRIDQFMGAFDGYMQRVSNGKASIGNYEVTPIYESSLTIERVTSDFGVIETEMLRLANLNGVDRTNKFVYYLFDELSFVADAALGLGNGQSPGKVWWPAKLNTDQDGGGWIHEGFHMFDIPHLGLIETEGNVSYPGTFNPGGLDPYNFMGTEGGLTNWNPLPNNPSNGLVAPIPVAIKRRLGWVTNQNLVEIDDVKEERHRIFISDVVSYPDTRKLGILLNGYSENSFTISYNKNTTASSGRVTKDGVLVHELRNGTITALLDANPNSVDGSPDPRRQTDAWKSVFEFTDAAVQQSNPMKVGNLFTVTVENEGGTGDDRWADIVITPNPNFKSKKLKSEEFDYSSYSELKEFWSTLDLFDPLITLNNASLQYPGLKVQGRSITFTPNETVTKAPISITRKLDQHCEGDTFWLSFLVSTNKLGEAVFSLNIDSAFSFSLRNGPRGVNINSSSEKNTQLAANQTYLMVAKYVLKPGNDDVFLWVNPSINSEPSIASVDAKRLGAADYGPFLKNLSLTVRNNQGNNGNYTFDRIRTSLSYSGLFTDTSPPTPVAQTPFNVTTVSLPGVIDAENYDNGGQDVAYNDTTPNNIGGKGRVNEGVDLENASDGSLNIGFVSPGEWVEYTVNVATSGTYTADINYASNAANGGIISLAFDGTDKTGAIALQKTAGWQSYVNKKTNEFQLDAGEQVLRVNIVSGAYNLNKIEIKPVAPKAFGLSEKIEAELGFNIKNGSVQNTPITTGGKNIGFISANFSAAYNVDIPTAGKYDFIFKVASITKEIKLGVRQGRSIFADGTRATTGAWHNYQDLIIKDVQIVLSGPQEIEIVANGDGWNFDSFEIIPATETPTPPTTITGNWIEIGGAAQNISVDNAGKAWVVNTMGQMYARNGNSWRFIRGNVQDVGAGAIVSITETNNTISSKGNNAVDNSFSRLPGSSVKVDVDSSNRTWVVNAANQIYRRDGNRWTQIPGTAIDIGASGTSSNVYRVDTTGNIFRFENNSWTQTSGSNAVRIDVDSQGSAWMVDNINTLFKYNLASNTWTIMWQDVVDVACGAKGSIWVTDLDTKIYRFSPTSAKSLSSGLGIQINTNPVTNGIIELTNSSNASYTISTISGQKVLSGSVTNNTINVSDLSAGLFIIQFVIDGKTQIEKVIIK